MFVRNGAATPGPSRECDITFFVKGRPKSARQSRDSTVAARRVQSVTVPSSRVSRECRSPGLRSPPFKNARFHKARTSWQVLVDFCWGCSLFFGNSEFGADCRSNFPSSMRHWSNDGGSGRIWFVRREATPINNLQSLLIACLYYLFWHWVVSVMRVQSLRGVPLVITKLLVLVVQMRSQNSQLMLLSNRLWGKSRGRYFSPTPQSQSLCLSRNVTLDRSLSLAISLSLYLYISLYQSINQPTAIDQSTNQSINQYLFYQSIYLSIYRSIYLSIHLSIYPFVYLFLAVSTSPSLLSRSLNLYNLLSLSLSLSISLSLFHYKCNNRSIYIYIYLSLSLSFFLSLSCFQFRNIDLPPLTSLSLSEVRWGLCENVSAIKRSQIWVQNCFAAPHGVNRCWSWKEFVRVAWANWVDLLAMAALTWTCSKPWELVEERVRGGAPKTCSISVQERQADRCGSLCHWDPKWHEAFALWSAAKMQCSNFWDFSAQNTCDLRVACWKLRNICHHHPENKKRKSSEANSGSIHPSGRYENAVKTRKTISTIAILRPVKAIFEKRAATVEVDSFVSPGMPRCNVANCDLRFEITIWPFQKQLLKRNTCAFAIEDKRITQLQLGPFFVLKFLRSRGLSSTVSKVHSDRKVLFEQKNGPLMAVNGR